MGLNIVGHINCNLNSVPNTALNKCVIVHGRIGPSFVSSPAGRSPRAYGKAHPRSGEQMHVTDAIQLALVPHFQKSVANSSHNFKTVLPPKLCPTK